MSHLPPGFRGFLIANGITWLGGVMVGIALTRGVAPSQLDAAMVLLGIGAGAWALVAAYRGWRISQAMLEETRRRYPQ